MSSLDLQGLILTNPVNIRYLTNIEAEGIFLLTRKENIYITDARYIEQVHSTLTLFDEIIEELKQNKFAIVDEINLDVITDRYKFLKSLQ